MFLRITKRGRYTTFKDNLRVKEVIVGDGERRRRYILCYNPIQGVDDHRTLFSLFETNPD
jgi:hypothetical protein